jgi:hypothetical protein
MITESKLTLTQSCELTHIFGTMNIETLGIYAEGLKNRMNQCAINYIEGGPFIEQTTYNEMKDIYEKVEQALVNEQVNVL